MFRVTVAITCYISTYKNIVYYFMIFNKYSCIPLCSWMCYYSALYLKIIMSYTNLIVSYNLHWNISSTTYGAGFTSHETRIDLHPSRCSRLVRPCRSQMLVYNRALPRTWHNWSPVIGGIVTMSVLVTTERKLIRGRIN